MKKTALSKQHNSTSKAFAKQPDSQSTKYEYVYYWILNNIQEQRYLPNHKLPSIRKLATMLNLSSFTISSAYDLLVADGYVRAVKGVGYYVEKVHFQSIETDRQNNKKRTDNVNNSTWLMQHLFNNHPENHYPGRGRLPTQWIPKKEFCSSIKKSFTNTNHMFTSYGSIHGLKNLRQLFAKNLNLFGLTADIDNIITTAGVSGAIDLITDYLLSPGDVVLIDDPCWFWIISCLKMKKVQIISIERTAAGPNIEQIKLAVSQFKPKLYITNAVLHNPTSFNLSPFVIHEVINLAKQYDFYILEDDIYSELVRVEENIRYVSLDDNSRVFYCSSPSKIIGGNFKVGLLYCPKEHTDGLLNQKMLSQMCVAEMNEQAILDICLSPHYRKHVEKVSERLLLSHEKIAKQIQKIGLTYPEDTNPGLFVWQQLPCNASTLAFAAKKDGWLIAPGNLFSLNEHNNNYMRLNVALTNTDFFYWLDNYLNRL